jgi:hypothetical protein
VSNHSSAKRPNRYNEKTSAELIILFRRIIRSKTSLYDLLPMVPAASMSAVLFALDTLVAEGVLIQEGTSYRRTAPPPE